MSVHWGKAEVVQDRAEVRKWTRSGHRPNGHIARIQSGKLSSALFVPEHAWKQSASLAAWFGWISYENSRQLNFVEKWFPGERLAVGLVKISIL